MICRPNKPKNGGITAGVSRVGQSKDAAIGDGAESGAEVRRNILPTLPSQPRTARLLHLMDQVHLFSIMVLTVFRTAHGP